MEKVKIKKFDYEANGIATLQGKKIFISNALPEEEVEIKIFENRKNYAKAKVINYIKKSNKRIDNPCPYKNCGGCDLLHLNYEDELVFKQNKINEIFYGKVKKIESIILSEKTFNYRNKITLKVNDKLGYYKRYTHEIIPIQKCLLAKEEINTLIKEISNLNLNGIKELTIRSGKNLMLIIETKKRNLSEFLKLNVDNIVVFNNNNFKTIKGNNFITDSILNINFNIKNNSFFQINNEQTNKLYKKIISLGDFNKEDTVLDLYSGIGSIALCISKYVKEVIGVEINKDAVLSANENKKINNIKNVNFYCMNVNKLNIINKINKVIVDPPRGGLDKKTIKILKEINAKKIIYVSCNPLTLKRDIELLNDKYKPESLVPIDMFPKTHHVECICVLKNLNKKYTEGCDNNE